MLAKVRDWEVNGGKEGEQENLPSSDLTVVLGFFDLKDKIIILFMK